MFRWMERSWMARESCPGPRAWGMSARRLILRTVVPNCLSVVIVQCSLCFAEVLLAEAALSFLGLGEAPPRPPLHPGRVAVGALQAPFAQRGEQPEDHVRRPHDYSRARVTAPRSSVAENGLARSSQPSGRSAASDPTK